MHALSKLVLILSLVVLVGCDTVPEKPPEVKVETVTVKVPVAMPCQTADPEKPTLAFPNVREEDDIFSKVKALLSDRFLMLGYITKLESALQSCK